MKKVSSRIQNTKRFESFPRSLAEAKDFLMSKGLGIESIDDEMLDSIVQKVNNKVPLTQEEVNAIHAAVDLGDTCGCDSDHRIRGTLDDGKTIGYSET